MRGWRMHRVRSVAAVALAGLLGLAPAQAQDEVSFRGKTVRMIVGSTAGGVTDVGARTVARFLGKYLPHSPAIVVQNMPAANGIAAANHFYQQVAPDGLTFLAGSSSQVTPDVIRTNPAVRYDPAKLVFIGGVFMAEALSVMIQVISFKSRGKRVFRMAPLHHHFELSGWSESKIIIRFWIASLILALFSLSTLKLR